MAGEFEDVDLLNSDVEEVEDEKVCSVVKEKIHEMDGSTEKKSEAEDIAENALRRVDELVSEPPSDWGVRVKADEVTDMICRLLNEPKRVTVLRAVKRMGNIVSNKLLRHTLAIEAMGGIKVNDGTRRREPGTFIIVYDSCRYQLHIFTQTGGVFWWLVKREVSADDLKFIFLLEKERKRKIRRRRREQLKGTRVRRTKNRNKKMRKKKNQKKSAREKFKERSNKAI